MTVFVGFQLKLTFGLRIGKFTVSKLRIACIFIPGIKSGLNGIHAAVSAELISHFQSCRLSILLRGSFLCFQGQASCGRRCGLRLCLCVCSFLCCCLRLCGLFCCLCICCCLRLCGLFCCLCVCCCLCFRGLSCCFCICCCLCFRGLSCCFCICCCLCFRGLSCCFCVCCCLCFRGLPCCFRICCCLRFCGLSCCFCICRCLCRCRIFCLRFRHGFHSIDHVRITKYQHDSQKHRNNSGPFSVIHNFSPFSSPCSVVARALSMIFKSSKALLNFKDSFFSAQTISPCQVEFSRYCTCTTNVPFFPSVFLFFSSCKHLTHPPIWFSVYRNFSISSIIPNILFLNLFRLCYFSYFFVPFERVLSYHWCTVSLYEM